MQVVFDRGDMRRLPYKSTFDLVINLFTSFGYFDADTDDEQVLRNVARALRPKGSFLIDLNNPIRTIARFAKTGTVDPKSGILRASDSEKLSNSIRLQTDEEFDPVTMRWVMIRSWKEKGRAQRYRTSVRLRTLPELTSLLEQCGFKVKKVWGNFAGLPYSASSSRMIVLAQKM